MPNLRDAVPCIASLTSVPHLEDLVERDKKHDCAGFGPHGVCVMVDAVAASAGVIS